MKLSKTFLFPVVSSLVTVAASAALPTFSPQAIELPPLTLRDAKASLHPSSLLTVAASAAQPTFSPQTIELTPPTLIDNAKASLHPFEGHAPAASMPIVIPDRQSVSSDKFVITPRTDVDYKLLIKHPDPDVDYKLIVKQVDPQSGK